MGFNLFDPLGLDPFGTDAAKSAKKANEANLKKIGGLYQDALGLYTQDQGAAVQRQKQVTSGLRTGMKTGLLNLATQGNASRQRVIDQGQRSLDTGLMQQENRGVFSSALSDQLRRSNVYDVNSALDGIDEAVARLAADYQMNGENAIAQSGSREASLMSQGASGKAGLTQDYMGILGGVQHTAGPTAGQQLLGLLPALAAL